MDLVEELTDPLRCKTEKRAVLSDGVLNITGKQHLLYACVLYQYMQHSMTMIHLVLNLEYSEVAWKLNESGARFQDLSYRSVEGGI